MNPVIMAISELGTLTLTPNAECLAMELSLTVLTTSVCRGWDSNTQLSACVVYALTHCATATASFQGSLEENNVELLTICNVGAFYVNVWVKSVTCPMLRINLNNISYLNT